MTALWERLRERKLVQWVLAYLAGAWLLLQVLALLADSFGWPSTVMRIAIVLLGVGLLAVGVLAWFHGERGEQRVSGVELAIFAVLCVLAGAGMMRVGSGDAETGTSSGTAATPLPEARTSLAALRFADLGVNRDQEYFSDGITDELISTLSTIPGLRVASRTSSFGLKGKNVAVRKIGDELQVGTVLVGSVRRAGDSLRITAQLVDVAGGHTLWTDTYERGAADVLTVQQQIARSIAAALRVRLGAGRTHGSSSPEAYDLYLKGTYEWRNAEMPRAIDYFRQAVALDSSFALAHAGLSRAYQYAYLYLPEFSVAASLQQADGAARRALALDSTLAEAAAGNRGEARRLLAAAVTRSIALPGRIAVVYAALGEPDSAFVWLDRWAAEPALNFITWPFDPGLAPLRDDPRYGVFLRKMGVR